MVGKGLLGRSSIYWKAAQAQIIWPERFQKIGLQMTREPVEPPNR
jgi:hypothetical protein